MMRIWLAELDTQAYRFPRCNRRSNIPPVYPLLRIPINLTRSAAARCLPGGMDRAAARGDREQKAWLHTMTGLCRFSIRGLICEPQHPPASSC